MFKKKIIYLMGILLAVGLLLTIRNVNAHNPSNMTLVYNSGTETLSVTITHTSANFNSHYIFEVIGTANGGQAINGSYTSQPSNTFTYNYNVTAMIGDIIEVTARCTQAGIITRSITVGQPTEAISGYAGLLLIIGVSTIILIAIISKKLKNRLVIWR
jgi:hypothetical protein